MCWIFKGLRAMSFDLASSAAIYSGVRDALCFSISSSRADILRLSNVFMIEYSIWTL